MKRRHLRHPIGAARLRILTAIGTNYRMKLDQVIRLLYSAGSLTHGRHLLADLTKRDYLERIYLPNAAPSGTAPVAYQLRPKSFRLLAEHGVELPYTYRQLRENIGFGKLLHDLEVVDTLVLAQLAAREHPDLRIVDLQHDRDLHRNPFRISFSAGNRTKQATLVFDGFIELVYSYYGNWQFNFLLEIDRGFHTRTSWQRKAELLIGYLKGDYHEQHFGTRARTIVILATSGPERANDLRRWTEVVLKRQGAEQLYGDLCFAGGNPATFDPIEFFLAPQWQLPFTSEPVPLIDPAALPITVTNPAAESELTSVAPPAVDAVHQAPAESGLPGGNTV